MAKNPFKGKLAVVTGSSAGIGAQIAKNLAQDGADVVLVARRRDRLEQVKAQLATYGTEISILEGDLANPQGIAKLIADLERLPRPVDILVNNAGFGVAETFTDSPWEKTERMLELNVMAVARLTHWAATQMKARKTGYILNIASTAAFQPIPYFAAYGASKSFVSNLSMALHRELKPHGVVVSCLHPGKTNTEFFDVADMHHLEFAKKAPGMDADTVARIGLDGLRAGKASTIAGASNKISYLGAKLAPVALTTRIAESMFKP